MNTLLRFRASLLALAPLLALGTSACFSTTYRHHDWDGFLLNEGPADAATTVAWRLFPGDDGAARIHRTETRRSKVARLGVVVDSIDSRAAESLGVEAWQGVRVRRVDRGSPAAEGGLRADDVLLALGGVDVTSEEQFRELVTERAVPGEPIEVLVRRRPRSGDPGEGTLVVSLVPEPKEVSESKTDSFRLDSSPGVEALTGMQVAVIPEDLSREIFEREEPVVVVAGVVTGSPAYLAGLRGGDRIVECDGEAVASIDVVRRAVLARAQKMPLEAGTIEGVHLAGALRRTDEGEPEAPRKGDVDLRVDGALGRHRAQVEVVNDLNRRSSFDVPIVLDYSSSAQSTRWSFLDFIFQFGGNYEGSYQPSATRAPARRSRLSLFPLGMFEFERGRSHRSYRLFWLIRWRTRA